MSPFGIFQEHLNLFLLVLEPCLQMLYYLIFILNNMLHFGDQFPSILIHFTFSFLQYQPDNIYHILREMQRKREQFRSSIRRQHIERLFERRREQFQNQRYYFNVPDHEKRQKCGQILGTFLHKVKEALDHKNYESVLDAVQEIGKEISMIPEDMSFCLCDFVSQHLQSITDIFVGQPSEEALGEIEEEEGMNMNPITLQQAPENPMIVPTLAKVLQLARIVQWHRFHVNAAKAFLQITWSIIHQKYFLPINQPSTSILNSLLHIWTSFLRNPQTRDKLNLHLKQLSVDNVICMLIDLDPPFQEVKQHLLHFLSLYHTEAKRTNEEQHKIYTEIELADMDSEVKCKEVLYCIQLIMRGEEECYVRALEVIRLILNVKTFITSSLTHEYLHKILTLTRHSEVEISQQALSTVTTITFTSEDTSDELVKQLGLLDFVYDKLMEARTTYNKQIVEKCNLIMCNLLLTKNKQVIGKIQEHLVWGLIFEGMVDENPLLPLMSVYEYYFNNPIGRKKCLKILPSFLNAFGALNRSNSELPFPQIESTLQIIYLDAKQFWPENEFEHIESLFYSNNLQHVIEQWDDS